LRKPKKPKFIFTSENGLPTNVYCSFEGRPRKKANKPLKLYQEDNEVNTLFATRTHLSTPIASLGMEVKKNE